ncbi:MAG TPA: lipoprotein [Steroidobacteraceae bacterium]|nr:lipoprotein [Steroidobacteraceae bacterium]
MNDVARQRLHRWSALGFILLGAGVLAGCGQTGKLYLPEGQGEVVTRPTQTPPPETGADAGRSPNSPQTVDSPRSADTPATVVSGPEGNADAKKDKKDGAQNPPPESQPKN